MLIRAERGLGASAINRADLELNELHWRFLTLAEAFLIFHLFLPVVLNV